MDRKLDDCTCGSNILTFTLLINHNYKILNRFASLVTYDARILKSYQVRIKI